MTAPSPLETAANADAPAELTDGYHLVVDALKMNDVDTIYGVVGIPITDLARLAQASGHPLHRLPPREQRGTRRGGRRLPHQEARHLPDGVGPGLPQRAGRARERHHQLLPDGADLRVQRAPPRRPQAGRLRGDGPARRRAAVRKAAYRVSRVEDIGRGIARALRTARLRPPGRRLPRHPRRGARLHHGRRGGREDPEPPRRPGTAPTARPRGRRPGDRAAGRRAAAADRARQGRRLRPGRRRRSASSSSRPASPTCRCRWPRACCPTTTRSPPPPPARWR